MHTFHDPSSAPNFDGASSSTEKRSTSVGRNEMSFAVITDSHVDPHVPERADRLNAVYTSILHRQQTLPEFIFHVGDIVEAGLPAEYAEYETTEPPELRNRIRAVPGNHEVRWDAWAKQNFAERFGDTPYSFDTGGIHFLALDPTQLLQEPGYFDPQHRQWLKNDLEQTGPETPIVVFVHYPMGADNYYIGNQDAFFELIEPYNVRALFAGHVHQERLWHQNGIAMITLPAVRNAPVYYWVDKKITSEDGPILSINHVEQDGLKRTEREVTQVPLTGDRPAESVRPRSVQCDTSSDSDVSVRVTLPSTTDVRSVECQWWPEYEWAWRYDGDWTELEKHATDESNPSWRTTLSTNGCAPGERRIQIRVTGRNDHVWDETTHITLDAETNLTRANTIDLGSPIRADLSIVEETDYVLAATVDGRIMAIDAAHPRQEQVWLFRIPEDERIVGSPAVSDDGETVFVGTTGHTVYALDVATGDLVWETELADPVLGDLVATVNESLALVPAGHALYALDGGTGDVHWERDVGGFVGGKPDVDDEAVYLGVGDGTVRSLDLETGAQRWETTVTARERPFRTLIYSAWSAKATVLPASAAPKDVFISSDVLSMYAFDRNTGDVVWQLDGRFFVSEPFVLPGSTATVVLTDEWGNVTTIDAETGDEQWSTVLPQRVFGPAPIHWNGTLYVTGVNGTVFGLSPRTGKLTRQFSFSTEYAFSSPVCTDEHLYIGGQDGMVHVLRD